MSTPLPLLGRFHWDQRTHSLHPLTSDKDDTSGEIKRLTHKQQALLSCLYTAYPSPVPHETIVNTVWGSGHISAESLPQLISRTRQILNDKKKSIIINHPGQGYSLSVTPIDSSEQKTSTEAVTVSESVIDSVDKSATSSHDLANHSLNRIDKNTQSGNNRRSFESVIRTLEKSLLNPTVIFIVLLIATLWNSWNYFSAHKQRDAFETLLFHTPYTQTEKRKNPKQLNVTIGKETCLYDQTTKTLDCP